MGSKSTECFIRITLFAAGTLMIGIACLAPLLGQYLSYHGPTWMTDEVNGLGFGTILSLALTAIGSAVLGMYLMKEATE